eukprot:SAG25_NODE_1181_length_3670_cov_3.991319_2_plen_64_part_00
MTPVINPAAPRAIFESRAPPAPAPVRVEIMGSQKCGIVGKSQPALIVINPMIFTRTCSVGESR